jgi:putative glutamine amidotransferase
MSTKTSTVRIGIYGDDLPGNRGRGCGLWPVGHGAAVSAAGGTPVHLHLLPGCSWDELLDNLDGVVFGGAESTRGRRQAEDERLCEWCRELSLPLLGIDHGLHVLNTVCGGSLHHDVGRDLPLALQHRHPPEEGLRHAISVLPGTRLARFYGEGEIVVNSLHQRAVDRVARGFRVSGRALDGAIEAIEAETNGWLALGVQWHPASASASGLDIQLFRGFVTACKERHPSAALCSSAA